ETKPHTRSSHTTPVKVIGTALPLVATPSAPAGADPSVVKYTQIGSASTSGPAVALTTTGSPGSGLRGSSRCACENPASAVLRASTTAAVLSAGPNTKSSAMEGLLRGSQPLTAPAVSPPTRKRCIE